MVCEEGDSSGGAGVMGLDGEAVNTKIKANGFVVQAENGSTKSGNNTRSSGKSLRTYKRRKRARAECPKFSGDSTAQIKEKSTKEFPDMDLKECSSSHTNVAGMGANACMPGPHDSSLKHSRDLVLEQLCKSLDGEGGLQECIRGSLVFPPENGCTSAVKESFHSGEEGRKYTSLFGPLHTGTRDAVSSREGVILDASANETNHQNVSELCKRTFSDVIMSEKFALLCNILLENFQGIKADKLLNVSFMNSRMKEGAYEKSPVLFLSDIQQVWTKLQKVGTDIVALSNNLYEKSRASYCERIGGLLHGTSDDGPHAFVTEESDMHAKVEQMEARGIYKVCTCKRCGGRADGKDFLVCDSCEEMYHISCIEPAVTEIPLRSWYCASCTAKGIESPHDNCVVCERLSASRSVINHGVDELSNGETFMELEESSNGLTDDDIHFSEGKNTSHCNICKTEIKNGEKLKICGHDFCPHKFYHGRCLTSKQLEYHSSRWYCPSCLCRVCLADHDDEKIVLCDSCDHAYHIYCMQPPQTIVPRGKWFCRKCDAEIRCIRKAKRTFESLQKNELRKRSGEGKKASHTDLRVKKRKKDEALEKSGGVDMLLNAAKTLNYEENVAARRIKGQS